MNQFPSFSAPGYRDAGNNGLFGALGGIGLHGYSWSTAANGILGRFLWFNTQDLYPCHAASRGYGFQLRCLSEQTVPLGTRKLAGSTLTGSLYPK
ncbi:hypothetical protein [uncultured Rikenella sp.]|uniref:hypothetical protein n=1 Tax=uncultured Rikenella sp. TaxID=368003 RepID=UPI0025D68CE5|nr:hypothetical protein [uncultured Rikenella sp.]